MNTEDDVLDLVDLAALSELASNVEQHSKQSGKQCFQCVGCNIDFRELVEAHELSLGDCLPEKVYLALKDPWYNVLRVWND